MKTTRLAVAGLSAAALFALASQARATQVLVNGNVVISNDFNVPPNIDGAPPVSEVGTFNDTVGSPDSNVTTSATPGPFEGNGYLRVGNSHLGGDVSAATGQTFTFDSEVYVPVLETTLSDNYQFAVKDTAGYTGNIDILTDLKSGTVNAYYGGAYHPTGTTIIGNQWQDWKISWTAGSPTFSWTVDGVGDTNIPAYDGSIAGHPAGNSVGSFLLFGNQTAAQSIFLDSSSIPEPATLALLGIPLAGLMLKRRRAQRA